MNTIEGKVISITSNNESLFALTDRGTIYVSPITEANWIIFETKQDEKAYKLTQLEAQVTKLKEEITPKEVKE